MKIAIIGHKRIPSNEGGIEKGVEQHAVRMVQRGNDVTVYNRGGHNVFGKEFDGRITIFRSTLDSMSNQTIENRVVSKALQGSDRFRTD